MILSYSLISSLILGFGYLAYRLIMSGERQHSFNRSLILLIYAAAILLSFLILALLMRHPVPPAAIATVEVGELTGGVLENQATALFGWLATERLSRILFQIYIVGIAVVLIYSLFGAVMLWNIIRKGERIDYEEFSLVLLDTPVAPFSWKHSVIMSRSDYEEAGDMILLHECAHLRLSHWADLLLAQAVICLQWYNPAAWTMKEDLKTLHEYQADEAVIGSGVDLRQYQMLLIKKAVGSRFQSLTNSLNHSKLKKRVTMMYKKKTSFKRQLGALVLVPALAAGCAVTAVPAVAGVLESFASASSTATPSTDQSASAQEKVYTAVEKIAEFPGGEMEMMQYLMRNIKYPESAYKANEQGLVIVKFVVEKDGSIGDVEVIRSVTPDLDKEAIRVIKAMPKWIPAKVNGKPVASFFHIPVNFRLQENEQESENQQK